MRPRTAYRQPDALGDFAKILERVRDTNASWSLAGSTQAEPTPEPEHPGPRPESARLCLSCGADLEAVDQRAVNPNGERITCSSKCRQRLYRQRQQTVTP